MESTWSHSLDFFRVNSLCCIGHTQQCQRYWSAPNPGNDYRMLEDWWFEAACASPREYVRECKNGAPKRGLGGAAS